MSQVVQITPYGDLSKTHVGICKKCRAKNTNVHQDCMRCGAKLKWRKLKRNEINYAVNI